MKKAFYIFLILVSCLGVFFVPSALAAGPYLNKVEIVFFWGDGCPHCAAAEAFLSRLQAENSSITVKSFEVWNNQDNLLLLQRIGQYLKANIGGVPFTVVGDRYFSGFLSSETTGQQIEQAVELCQVRGCTSVLDTLEVAASETTTPESDVVSTTEAENKLAGEKVTLPLVGEINLGQTPLFLLTTIIGFLDGFNPCAMWVLLLLISLLLGMENKRRRWLLGSAFIFVSGAVYFLFLAAWLNIFLFIGVISIVRLLIAATAIVSGGLNLRAWYRHKTGCLVEDNEKRKRVFEKLRQVVAKKNFFLALGGIALLAAAVNLVELMCSAGLPAIFTRVLTMSSLSSWSYYLYLLWYIIIFMLDDMVVFVVAMVSLQALGVSSKYSLTVKLVGGVILLLLGILLIFKPGLLTFS